MLPSYSPHVAAVGSLAAGPLCLFGHGPRRYRPLLGLQGPPHRSVRSPSSSGPCAAVAVGGGAFVRGARRGVVVRGSRCGGVVS
eukprot:1896805-Alexandrium_andersonii.AAC.1